MRVIALTLVLTIMIVTLSACGDGDRRSKPAASNTTIEPRESIGGVRLGAGAGDVQARLGPPDSMRSSKLHGAWMEWRYSRQRLRVTLTDRRVVWAVRTSSPRYRTRSGMRVGSAERQVRRAVSSVHCRPYGGGARFGRWRMCVDTATYSGPFTSFTLVRGRVRSVAVAQGLVR